MFTPIIRLTLLVLCSILGIVSAILGWNYLLAIVALVSLAILWGYVNVGTVYLALHKLRKGRYEESEEIINLMRKPEKLKKSRRAYYYFIKGYLAREKDDFNTAKRMFTSALEDGLKTEQDRVISLLALADIALINKNKSEARLYMDRITGLKVQESLLPQVRQMQAYLAE